MFEYLSTTQGISRFVFTVLIGWCLLEAALAVYNGVKGRKRS